MILHTLPGMNNDVPIPVMDELLFWKIGYIEHTLRKAVSYSSRRMKLLRFTELYSTAYCNSSIQPELKESWLFYLDCGKYLRRNLI